MRSLNLLFSFSGRANRARFWLIVLSLIIMIFATPVLNFFFSSMLGPHNSFLHLADIFVIFLIMLQIMAFYCTLVVSVQRLHDMNASGMWLIAVFGVAAASWAIFSAIGVRTLLDMPTWNFFGGLTVWGLLLVLGAVKGDKGANKYGPDSMARVRDKTETGGVAQAQTDEVNALAVEYTALYDQGRYTEAIPLAQRLLAIREKSLDSNHADIATLLNNLGPSTCSKAAMVKPNRSTSDHWSLMKKPETRNLK